MLLHSEAAERNTPYICGALVEYLRHEKVPHIKDRFQGERPVLLEVAGGSGQHLIGFAEAIRNEAPDWADQIQLQSTDLDPKNVKSIQLRRELFYQENPSASEFFLGDPFLLNLNQVHESPELKSLNPIWGLIAINLLQVSPWPKTAQNLFALAKETQASFVMVYSPLKRSDQTTAESNLRFDESLKTQNPEWGVRSWDELAQIANEYGYPAHPPIDMPANNTLTFFEKRIEDE